jgi:hypothetical protein
MSWRKGVRAMPAGAGFRGALALLLVAGCLAGPRAAVADPFQEGYRKGFEDGYLAGQRAAQRNPGPAGPTGGAVVNRGIVVMHAVYGDGRRECTLTGPLAGLMNGRTSAKLEVTNSLCGDPAPGERKSLTIDYVCDGTQKRASAYEHRTIFLSCP